MIEEFYLTQKTPLKKLPPEKKEYMVKKGVKFIQPGSDPLLLFSVLLQLFSAIKRELTCISLM